jgi:hypothetical protein
MKAIFFSSVPSLLQLLVLAMSPQPIHAQLPPHQPWNTAAVDTIGGITYFTFGGRLPNCHWIETGPLSDSGGAFALLVWEMVGEICLDCLDCYNLQTNSVVLGRLPPGDYIVQATYATIPGIPLPSDPIIYQSSFTVPAMVEPTLRVSRAGEQIQIDVVTALAAEATIEASADMRRWVPFPTRADANGPFSITVGVTNQHQFFRARVVSGSVLRLVF